MCDLVEVADSFVYEFGGCRSCEVQRKQGRNINFANFSRSSPVLTLL